MSTVDPSQLSWGLLLGTCPLDQNCATEDCRIASDKQWWQTASALKIHLVLSSFRVLARLSIESYTHFNIFNTKNIFIHHLHYDGIKVPCARPAFLYGALACKASSKDIEQGPQSSSVNKALPNWASLSHVWQKWEVWQPLTVIVRMCHVGIANESNEYMYTLRPGACEFPQGFCFNADKRRIGHDDGRSDDNTWDAWLIISIACSQPLNSLCDGCSRCCKVLLASSTFFLVGGGSRLSSKTSACDVHPQRRVISALLSWQIVGSKKVISLFSPSPSGLM